MKILVAYYSAGGNTQFIAKKIIEKMKNNKVDEVKVEQIKEYSNIFSRYIIGTKDARNEIRKQIKDTIFDLSHYDLIIIGSPIWASKLPPAMNTYLDKLFNCEGKSAIAYVTSHLGFISYVDWLANKLKDKGLKVIGKFSFIGRKIREENLNEIINTINEGKIK